jgi:hypothetical protein
MKKFPSVLFFFVYIPQRSILFTISTTFFKQTVSNIKCKHKWQSNRPHMHTSHSTQKGGGNRNKEPRGVTVLYREGKQLTVLLPHNGQATGQKKRQNHPQHCNTLNSLSQRRRQWFVNAIGLIYKTCQLPSLCLPPLQQATL